MCKSVKDSNNYLWRTLQCPAVLFFCLYNIFSAKVTLFQKISETTFQKKWKEKKKKKEKHFSPMQNLAPSTVWVWLCFWLHVGGHDNQKTRCMCPNLPMMSSFSTSSPVIGWLAQHLLSLMASTSSPRWRPIRGSTNHGRLSWQPCHVDF